MDDGAPFTREEKKGTTAHVMLVLVGLAGGLYLTGWILDEPAGVVARGVGFLMLPIAHALAIKGTAILALIVWVTKYVVLAPFFVTRWMIRKISGYEPEPEQTNGPSAAAAFLLLFPLVGICVMTTLCGGAIMVFAYEQFSVEHPMGYFAGVGALYGLVLWLLIRAGLMTDVEVSMG